MNLKRWTLRLFGGVLAFASMPGCKQQLFLEPADYKSAISNIQEARLESSPHEPIIPAMLKPDAQPATVIDPSRPARSLRLPEAIAIALEGGNVGVAPSNNAGFTNDTLPQFTGRGSTGTDKLAAFAIDPAVATAEIERSLSKFDARWINSLTWNKNDQPIQSFQQNLSNGDTATMSSTLAKPLPTGGVAGITFSTSYQHLSNPPSGSSFSTLGTSYTPQVQFVFEQPLLQGFGVEINQLAQSHPGSLLINGLRASGGTGTEGILVTRIRQEQQRAEFDRQLNGMLLNVEVAYWNLYYAYYNLAAQEEALKQSFDGFCYFRERYVRGAARQQQMYQAKAQYELFRSQVISARGQVLSSERQLRGLLGMRSDDGVRLVPSDEPILAPYTPDYLVVANESLQNRPELLIARQELKARQMDLILQKNLRRPDLRFLSSYTTAGIGTGLDGSGTTVPNGFEVQKNAFRSLALDNFNSWQIGFRLDMPLGFRDANALVRESQLNMRKSYYQLIDSERKATEFVSEWYRKVAEAQETIKSRREQRINLEKYVELDKQIRDIGGGGRDAESASSFIANLLQAQRDLASATAAEYRAIADYNIALATLEYAKGTIQRYNNVSVSDGPLPEYVRKKAVDHFREMDAGLKLRERSSDLPLGPIIERRPMGELPQAEMTPTAPQTTPQAPAAMPPLPTPAPQAVPPAAPSTPQPMPTVPGRTTSLTPVQPTPTAPNFTAVGTLDFPKRTAPPPATPTLVGSTLPIPQAPGNR